MFTIKFTFRKPDHNQSKSFEHRFTYLIDAQYALGMLKRAGAKNIEHNVPSFKQFFASTVEAL